MSHDLRVSAPQGIFLNDLDTKFRAYVGGFGSGKTFVGCLDQCLFAGQNPKTTQGYFAPTYRDIRDTFWPTMDEAADLLGFRTKIKRADKEVDLYRGRVYYGTTICRSMDDPGSIVGFKIARAMVDEIDILAREKASLAWRKIIARMRLVVPGVVNGIGVTTTPEGFRFVYDTFARDPGRDYSMVQASTYENEDFLPPDYIQSLRDTDPQELIDA
ncbi:terminase large subunit domain-containing protein [Roseovarius sp.]|uniref:terminase large subunit domain-containing protein n=1 Tax=Roseovarius sp. TaxID=1486281 RepID=UPI0035676D3F